MRQPYIKAVNPFRISTDRPAPGNLLPALLFLSLICLFLPASLGAEGFDTLQLEFRQETTVLETSQKFEGTVFYRKAPHLFVVHITNPINQFLFWKDDETLVYYPDDKKAFRALNADTDANAMEIEILSLFEKDMGLSLKGYNLTGIKAVERGIESRWTGPEDGPGQSGEIRVTSDLEERIISSKTYGGKGVLSAATVFGNYMKIRSWTFPTLSMTRNFSPEGETLGKTTLSISAVEIGKKLPDSITLFSLPADCEVGVLQ